MNKNKIKSTMKTVILASFVSAVAAFAPATKVRIIIGEELGL
jgi:hypothetical protein